jgi:excisionase family DNA binding protein
MAAEPTPRHDEPVTADECEVDAVRKVARLLDESARDDAAGAVRLTTADGQALDLPASIRKILRQAIPLLTQGDAVTVTSLHKEMTTQEAADFLNVSRPSLIKLLEDGAIPYIKVGTHRRVRLSDVLAYRQQRSNVRKDLFQWMLDVAQEHNAYD